MKIVIEPLSYSDSNYINTIEEGVALSQLVNHPSVGVLMDYYHHQYNGEDEAFRDI